MQSCGSEVTESGSGYGLSISSESKSGSRVLMTKNWRKKYIRKFFYIFVWLKLQFTYFQASGNLRPSALKDQHFFTPDPDPQHWLNCCVIPTCAEGSRWQEGPAARQSARRRTPGLSRAQTLPGPPTQTLPTPVEIRSISYSIWT